MISAKYRLVRPLSIERHFEDVSYSEGVVVKPSYLSICKADMRYFLGQRDEVVLKERLPLVLIHEAVGVVINDSTGELKRGTKVVLLPNIPGEGENYDENYRLDSRFRSSKADGFMQELMNVDMYNVVPYRNIPDNVASYTEFISVGLHAIKGFMKIAKTQKKSIGIWGDGALGYVICCLLKKYLPDAKITIIGVKPARLEMFSMADERFITKDLENKPQFDHVFECVGGQASGKAINQMIDVIQPEGTMMLLGVSEEPVPINTRMVLEKGITMLGRSRSTKEDFCETVRLMEEDAKLVKRLSLLISKDVTVQCIGDVEEAFEAAQTADYKVVMKWNI